MPSGYAVTRDKEFAHFMIQRNFNVYDDKKKNITLRNWLILAGIVVAAFATVTFILNAGRSRGSTATRLSCFAGQNVTPFGEYIVYYDGVSIHCLTHSGAAKWSQSIGAGASFSVGAHNITVWVNARMYILNYEGVSTYQDTLNEMIQFARVGKRYAAAVIGPETASTLVIRDLNGLQVDIETDAFRDAYILDVGFYGDQGQYLWVTLLDIYGTAANTTLKTFEVGRKNTGESMLGESTPYRMLYDNNRLRAVTTRQIRSYNYQGIENTSEAALVYGWRLIDAEVPVRGDVATLFVPTTQASSGGHIQELRYMTGSVDRRFTLPTACAGAVIYGNTIYAVSSEYIYRAEYNAQRFTAYELPVRGRQVTQVIGSLEGGRILIACGDEVYAVTLPGA